MEDYLNGDEFGELCLNYRMAGTLQAQVAFEALQQSVLRQAAAVAHKGAYFRQAALRCVGDLELLHRKHLADGADYLAACLAARIAEVKNG